VTKNKLFVQMKKFTLILIFLAVLLSSCSHYYYVADIQNVPLFKEKNQYRLSGAFGFGDESKCIEVQTAYALSDKIGILANFMSAWGGDVSDRDYGRGTCLDGGIGYFKPIKDFGVFEFYGGMGGSIQHLEFTGLHYNQTTGAIYNEYDGSADLSSFKLFIQPSFGVTYSVFDFIASTRISSLSFMSVQNNIYGNTYQYDDLNSISNKGQFFVEPAATLRGGWKNLKVQAQVSYIWHLNDRNLDVGEESHFSIGLIFILAKKAVEVTP
jgi:hypothetical protein